MTALDAISHPAREVLLEALMCVAWADRTLAEEELSAARAASIALGLVLPPERALTDTRAPVQPEQLELEGLSARDRELIYLCAAWMAMADEVEDPSETQILDRLQRCFALEDGRAAWLKERAVTLREDQGTSWWRAFDRLVTEAAKALSQET